MAGPRLIAAEREASPVPSSSEVVSEQFPKRLFREMSEARVAVVCGDATSRKGPVRSPARPTPCQRGPFQGCFAAPTPSSHKIVQQWLA